MNILNIKLYLCILMIFISIFIKNQILQFTILSITLFIIFYLLQKNMHTIVNLSKENIKVKNLKYANIFTIIFVFSILVINFIFGDLPKKQLDIINLTIISGFFLYFGNICLRIPFNRYFGLRLPWTVIDEQTWKYAHRLLGYISLPSCIIMFIIGCFINFEAGLLIGIFLIVCIPAILSYKFYKNRG